MEGQEESCVKLNCVIFARSEERRRREQNVDDSEARESVRTDFSYDSVTIQVGDNSSWKVVRRRSHPSRPLV